MNKKLMEKLGIREEDTQPKDQQKMIEELQEQNEMLTECILELSELLYN